MVAAGQYTESVSYAKQLEFTVVNRHPSGFSRDGGRSRIDVPKYKTILNEDRCVLTEKLIKYFNELWGTEYLSTSEDGVVTTRNGVVIGSLGDVAHKRFIRGSNSIWKVEQEKQGIKPTKDDNIIMIWGNYVVDAKNTPSDKGLLIFLLIHNANADFEFRDNSIAAASFKVQDHRRNAAKDIEKEDKVFEATEIVYQLRDKRTNGFDKDKISFYSNVFRTQISGYDSDEEKFRALLSIAKTNPAGIINGINSESVNYLQVIQQAHGLDILSREKGKVVDTMTNNTVVTFKVGASEEVVIQKLVDHYSSQAGEAEFKHLKTRVEAVKQSRIN